MGYVVFYLYSLVCVFSTAQLHVLSTSIFAEKIPIHYRSNKKQIVPVSSACAQDFTHVPVEMVSGDEDDSGRHSRGSLMSPKTQKAPAFLPGWCWDSVTNIDWP